MYKECFEGKMILKQRINKFHQFYSTCKYLVICRNLSTLPRYNLSEYKKTDSFKQKIWSIPAVWNIAEGLEIAVANFLPATTAITSIIYRIEEDLLVGVSGLIVSTAIHKGLKNLFNQFKTEGYIFLKEENEVINAKCELKRLQLEEERKKDEKIATECLDEEEIDKLLGVQEADKSLQELNKTWKCPDYLPEEL